MIGTIARKRSNLVALAAILALVAAMFAVLPRATANAVGDVDATSGYCGDAGNVIAEAGSTTIIQVVSEVDGDNVTKVNITCDAGDRDNRGPQHGKTVSITPNGTTDPEVAIKPVSLSVTIGGDSDGIVQAGGEYDVVVALKNFENAPTADEAKFSWVTVSSNAIILDAGTGANDLRRNGVLKADGTANVAKLVIPTTAPDGEYSISVRYRQNATTSYDGEATITVEAAGQNAAAAELELGFSVYDNPATTADETKAEDGSEAASDGDVMLKLSVSNSLGNAANKAGLQSMSVIGAGGTYGIHSATALGRPTTDDDGDLATALATGDNSAQVTDAAKVEDTMFVRVTKTDGKPGTVTLYAVVVGNDGSPTSNSIDLTFTGPADSASIAESADALRSVNLIETDSDGNDETVKDTIKLVVTAEDSAGNAVTPPTSGWSLRITGPDDKPVSATNISRSQPTPNAAQTAIEITLTNESGTAAAPLAPGAYTLSAKKGDLEAEVGFAVAGPTASIVLSQSSETTNGGLEIVTVDASLTDKDGNAVSDKTAIDIKSSDDSILTTVGVSVSGTTDGMASERFAVVGTGRAVITVTSNNVVEVTVFDNSADGTAGTGLGCLSELSGFATYTCSGDSSASELFALISARGASALHLWNGSAWVRYSVVDGAMVPGSSDFTVAANDILYVSN